MNVYKTLLLAVIVPLAMCASATAHAQRASLRLGANDMGGDQDAHYGAGVSVGASVGGRVAKTLSIHAELGADLLNYNWADQFESYVGVMTSLSVVSYAHVGTGKVKLLIGPKLGVFVDYAQSGGGDGMSGSGVGYGVIWGANAALMFRVGEGNTHVGPVVTWQSYWYNEFCNSSGGQTNCFDLPSDYNQTMVNASLAVWF